MSFNLKLLRRPRSSRYQHEFVKQAVRDELAQMADEMIKVLDDDVSDWEDKPKFKGEVKVTRVWSLEIRYDKRTRGGMHYKFVDKGTGKYGEKRKRRYAIVPKKAKALAFMTPNFPKTVPGTEGQRPVKGGAPGTQQLQIRSKVMHPGIRPRNFTQSLRDQYKGRKSGSFHARLEAAIKRGLRRIGKGAS